MLKSVVLKNFVHFKEKTVIVLNTTRKGQTEEQSTNAVKISTPMDGRAPNNSQREQTEEQSTNNREYTTPVGSNDLNNSQREQTEEQSSNTGPNATPMDNNAQNTSQNDQTEGQLTNPVENTAPMESCAINNPQIAQTEEQSTNTSANTTPIGGEVLNDSQREPSKKQSTNNGKNKIPMHSNGLNIFVGANFCGKSTVIKLIKRRMTDEINVSFTRSWDEKTVAYAFCQFDLPPHGEVISGIIKEPKMEKMYKIFIYKNCTLVRSKLSGSKTIRSFSFEEQEGKEVIEPILNKKDHGTSDDSLNYILKKITQSKKEASSNKPNWKSLKETFIATFPLRGIGSVQWTRSKRIGRKHKASNYKIANERAEIISTLLLRENCNKLFKEENETRIFNFLTYLEVFKFKRVGRKIQVQHDDWPPFDLLKTSEGIIEAKVNSLLLALEDNTTLCLEEPDRGMHPQMIERLKIVLYNSARRKTIIVVTHSPYFIDSFTVHKTHVFIRNRLYDPYVCSVMNVGKNSDLSRVADNETLRTLLFATKVLLVEGASDRDVVQAILTEVKCVQIEKSEHESSEEKNRDYLSEDISTHQIIPIGGCDNVDKVQAFCDYINVPCLCLLDRDKVIKYKDHKPNFWGKRKDRVTIKKLGKNWKIQGPETFENIEDYIEALQSKLKETTCPKDNTRIREIISFWQKEKRDEDNKNYIESLEKKVCPGHFLELRRKPFVEYLQDLESKTGCRTQESEKENIRKIANFWQKRHEENHFNTYIDELNKQKETITPSKEEDYLNKLESNRKTFVWRNGALEDAILSSKENNWKISEVFYSREKETAKEMPSGSKAQNATSTNTGQKTREDDTPNPIQCAAYSNESEKTANAGQSSKNEDVIADTSTNTGQKETEDETPNPIKCAANSNESEKTANAGHENGRLMTTRELKTKLKERLDDYTRQQLCKCLMDNEELKKKYFIYGEGRKINTIYRRMPCA